MCYELGVTSLDTRAASSILQVTSSNTWVADSNRQVTSSNPRVRRLKF